MSKMSYYRFRQCFIEIQALGGYTSKHGQSIAANRLTGAIGKDRIQKSVCISAKQGLRYQSFSKQVRPYCLQALFAWIERRQGVK